MIKGGEQLIRLAKKPSDRVSLSMRDAVLYLRKRLGAELPSTALVLGSGFQQVLAGLAIAAELEMAEIAGFPQPKVKGHSGRIVVAEVEGKRLLVLSGRSHFYEGHAMGTVVAPVRLLAESGVTRLILTNAAGSINPSYKPGDFMLFSDHINFIGVNPLRGLPVEDGRCFVDLSDTYSLEMRNAFKDAAAIENLTLHEGVYLGVCGPSYETPAEIRAFRTLGADAVGMSTIPEVLMARYYGMKVAAFSCLTNYAAGLGAAKLSHQDVLKTGEINAGNAARLLRRFVIGG